MWWKKTLLVLAAVGAINWGLHALKWNVVDAILKAGSTAGMVVYYIIGLSGLYALSQAFK